MCFRDFLRVARHEIPPHEDFLRKRRAADEQDTGSMTAAEADAGTARAKIVQ
jgi:hypothetical protein